MSTPLKAALVAALLTALGVGATVLMGQDKGNAGAQDGRGAYGAAAAAALAGGDGAWWTGKATGAKHNYGWVHKQIKALFGDEGDEFVRSQVHKIENPGNLDAMSASEREEFRVRKDRFYERRERLEGATAAEENDGARALRCLASGWNRVSKQVGDPRFTTIAGVVMQGGKAGKVLAKLPARCGIAPNWEAFAHGQMPGTVTISGTSYDVTFHQTEIKGGSPTKRLTALAAVYEKGAPKGGSGLGLLMLVLAPLLTGAGTYAVANGLTKNIRGVAREIDRLGTSGNPDRHIRADGAEASLVARSVERMVGNLEFRAKHDGEDLEEVVSREQRVAEEIHQSLMSKNPPRLDGYEVETLFKPGFEIGGDHFEYFRIDESHLGIILLDTNVRGVPAALVMAAARAYVRTEAPGVLSPAEVLRTVNRSLAGDLPPGRHVTALYVVLNTEAGTATLASAGHLPLLVYRHSTGKMAMVNPEGLALGLDTGPVFEDALQEGEIPIGVGDRLVLYTDGALKVQNAEGEEFGEQRFYKVVGKEAPKNSQAFVNFVGGGIDMFHLDAQQNDDITISTIKRLR